MHGKKGGKSPKGQKKSPASAKKKLRRLSASNSNEDRNLVFQDAGTSTEEDINAYLDTIGSDTNDGKDLDRPLSGDSSSDESSQQDPSGGSILRNALESIRDSESLNSENTVISPPRSNVIVPSPTQTNSSTNNIVSFTSFGVIRQIFAENRPISSTSQPLVLEGVEAEEEEEEPVHDIAERPTSLVSPGHRPRISPQKRLPPAEADSNSEEPERSPPTPSKVPKTVNFDAFGQLGSPTTDTEYIMVEADNQNIGPVTDVLTPMTGSVTRTVKFLNLPSSRASSTAGTDETTRPSSESHTSAQSSKLYIQAIHEDRFTHMAINVAEKFRLIPDVQQQFLAESLQHVVLAEALAGKLTREHKLVSFQCANCAKGMKKE